MKYTLKDKRINIGKLPLLSTNMFGDTYKLNTGIAIKIFKDNILKKVINEDECEILSDIRCDRVLMPKRCIYKDNKFIGYSFELLHNKKNNKRISLINKTELLTNLEFLEEDFIKISENYVLLDGINPKNLVYCNGLYIPDVSLFKILNRTVDPIQLNKLNNYEFSLLLGKLLEDDLYFDKSISHIQVNNLLEILSYRDDDVSFSDYFDDLLSDSKNILQFVKRL